MHVNAYEAVFAIYLKLLRMRDCVRLSLRVHLCVEPCVCAWIFQLEESVHVHYLRQSAQGVPQRASVLLSVRSSRRQQGAPFQFTHQPQRQGVKARGITAGDFTFEGQDYQSGDPCEEVMREGDRRRGGRGRNEREGRATQCHPGIQGALFSGEHICQAAHLFDNRRCGVSVRGRLYPFPSLSCSSESKRLRGSSLQKTVIRVETQKCRTQSSATDCK